MSLPTTTDAYRAFIDATMQPIIGAVRSAIDHGSDGVGDSDFPEYPRIHSTALLQAEQSFHAGWLACAATHS